MTVHAPKNFDLSQYGISQKAYRNASPAALYQLALSNDKQSAIASSGALVAYSGEKTGRSPKDKRIVENIESKENIWWGDINIPFSDDSFLRNREIAIRALNNAENLYVLDGFAGWDACYRRKVRVITTRPYHALFMHNMLIRPTAEELENFGEPDYVIFNAGEHPADTSVEGVKTPTSVALSFERKEFVILGTEYAGEMKKGVFTIMNYLMPLESELPMHCSATVEHNGETSTILFGLSGTGKTTLSADPNRDLIGDDEHVWTNDGVFNIEGGCYAKAIDLSAEKEPDIFGAIRYGTVLENVILDENHVVDFADTSITQNTRASYPIEHIDNARIPCVAGQPKNVIFLTCDAFGVLPPVSKLSPAQAMYHFISGYTAKVAGTEMGVTEPQATFSACFGAPFMVWHPAKYAELLAEKIREHNVDVWLVNTGWAGGGYDEGERIKLKYSRAIVDAINKGELANAPTVKDPRFGFEIVTECPNVPSEILQPENAWSDKNAFAEHANDLVERFNQNFSKNYADKANEEIKAAAPKKV
ncbi:phosphoenolpyruvate carboxykinase (ATP) [Suttonella ornithocola]|uniref:Phosphoenolpyruvate carboxykinase (ATP) n=1 Tax=Suttonella ornithocola TaxID=279832 RepID=A0A380MSD1_9GAMM|nr:phosphoenolpyruvate carboxykinase (ATP) [Suttonella ornithocola]SUO95490.1 Phosphoenolpyruvate carboxykinase [ATP] [Suttonella ornithocola]